jgi:ribosomal-protein-serine acetyltransferase
MQKSISVNSHIELRAANPDIAQEKYEAAVKSRDHLLPWLSWARLYDNAGAEAMANFQEMKAKEFEDDTNYTYDIFYDGEFAGGVELMHLNHEYHSCEIGYWLSVDMTGKGIMTTAVNAITRAAFEDLDIHCAVILAAEQNIKSRAVAERCGFKLDAILPERIRIDGTYRSECVFSKINNQQTAYA